MWCACEFRVCVFVCSLVNFNPDELERRKRTWLLIYLFMETLVVFSRLCVSLSVW